MTHHQNNPLPTALQFLFIPTGLMLAFFVWPLLQTVWMSLHDYSHHIQSPAFIGLGNYTRLFQNPEFWQATWNTALLWLLVVPALVILPVFLAALVNQPLPGVSGFRLLLYLPVVVSMVVVGLAWKWLYAQDGLLNALLTQFNLPAINWLLDPKIALVAVAIVIIWKGAAYYMMMYVSQLQSQSKTLYEAASLDGANRWQQLWHVTIPHLRPMMLFVLMISTIGCLKVFTEIYVLTGGGPLGQTQTLVYFIYTRAFDYLDLGTACAAGLVFMLILGSISLVQFKLGQQRDGGTRQNQTKQEKQIKHIKEGGFA